MDKRLIKQSRDWFKKHNKLNIDLLLEEISVMPCSDMVDDFEPESDLFKLNTLLDGWYSVATNFGIVAYFSEESEALKYRLNYINTILNGA